MLFGGFSVAFPYYPENIGADGKLAKFAIQETIATG